MRKRCISFDEERSGRLSLTRGDLKSKDKIQESMHFILSVMRESFLQISRSHLHEVVTEHVGYKKKCGHWVSRVLADVH